MGKIMDRGGAQAQKKDITAVLNSLLLAQRQANQSRNSASSTSMATKRGAPAKKQRNM